MILEISQLKFLMKILSGYSAYGASIFYSNELQDYYVISDIESQNINDNFISISGVRFFNQTLDISSNLMFNETINISSTLISTLIIKETTPFVCKLEKCLICDEESSSQNLCIECNKANNYYPISPLTFLFILFKIIINITKALFLY